MPAALPSQLPAGHTPWCVAQMHSGAAEEAEVAYQALLDLERRSQGRVVRTRPALMPWWDGRSSHGSRLSAALPDRLHARMRGSPSSFASPANHPASHPANHPAKLLATLQSCKPPCKPPH